MRRKKSQRALDGLVYVFSYGTFHFFKMLPCVVYPHISGILAYFLLFNAGLKKKVRKNIRAVYKNTLSPEERSILVKKIFQNNVFFLTEFVLWTKLNPDKALKLIEFKNLGPLKKSCEIKKPVVLISGHIGNFSIMIASLVYAKIPMTMITRDTNNVYLSRFIDRIRKEKGIFGIQKDNPKKTIYLSSKWLRNGKTLCLLIDQHSGKGTDVQFFGNRVQAPIGAAVFARKYNADVFGAFIRHKTNFRHTVFIEGPYPIAKTTNAQRDFQTNTQFFYSRIEHYVKEKPEDWFTWLHRRFR